MDMTEHEKNRKFSNSIITYILKVHTVAFYSMGVMDVTKKYVSHTCPVVFQLFFAFLSILVLISKTSEEIQFITRQACIVLEYQTLFNYHYFVAITIPSLQRTSELQFYSSPKP